MAQCFLIVLEEKVREHFYIKYEKMCIPWTKLMSGTMGNQKILDLMECSLLTPGNVNILTRLD